MYAGMVAAQECVEPPRRTTSHVEVKGLLWLPRTVWDLCVTSVWVPE